MMQDRVEIATEKKVWEGPSLNTLQIIQTLGGDGSYEDDKGGNGPISHGSG